MDDQKFLSWLLLTTVLLNVGMNLVLIPANGIEGAAIATVLPEIMLTAVFTVRIWSKLRLNMTNRGAA